MAPTKSFKLLLPHLAKMLAGSEEYLSHQTALFLLGFANQPGEPITIVSPRRRRNRTIEGFSIVFVFHSSFDEKYTQKINVSGEQLKISNLEKTLIDLCKDQSYAPGLESMARLFCAVPYNLKELLIIARNTSDTVLKRVALMTAWSGRAAYYQLPLKYFKRTPIKLDNREEKDLIWNNLFFTKIPRRLLRLPVSQPSEDTEPTVRLWMELKALPEFCEKQFEAEMIFIRETPEPKINRIIEQYFSDIFLSFSKERLIEFLNGFNRESTVFPPDVPELLRSFLNNHSETLLKRQNDLLEWFFANLGTKKPEMVEALIFYGIKLKLEEEVFAKFEECCTDLFYSGRFKAINLFADHFIDSPFKLSPKMLLNISKTYSMQEKFDQALHLLESARDSADENDLSVMGQLHYATGIVYQRMERADDALSELFLARESFIVDQNLPHLARCELSLGNLYFSRGHPGSARAYYINGLNRARTLNDKALQGSFLANIGMVEYDLGNFIRAAHYFNQAYAINKMVKNFWTNSVVGMALGKLYLKLGHFSKAMRIFREVYPIRQERNHSSGLYEISSILAWICEITGRTAAAKTFWNQADRFDHDQLEPRSRFVGEMLRALNLFYHKEYQKAESLFAQMLETAETRNSSAIQVSDCNFGLATAKFFLGKKWEAAELFALARKTIIKEKARFQLAQIEFYAALFMPQNFPDINLAQPLKILLNSQVYDPLWPHYAKALSAARLPEADKYLQNHLEHTPPAAMKLIKQLFKDFDKIIKTPPSNRAGEFITLLSSNQTKTIHNDEYRVWQQSYPVDTLVFDAPAGKLVYNDSCEKLKPGSIPHSILLQLFLAVPHPVEIESLYRSAWGLEFDPEYDFGTFKSSLQRLKHCLKKVANTAILKRQKSTKGLKAVRLSVTVPWLLAFR